MDASVAPGHAAASLASAAPAVGLAGAGLSQEGPGALEAVERLEGSPTVGPPVSPPVHAMGKS